MTNEQARTQHHQNPKVRCNVVQLPQIVHLLGRDWASLQTTLHAPLSPSGSAPTRIHAADFCLKCFRGIVGLREDSLSRTELWSYTAPHLRGLQSDGWNVLAGCLNDRHLLIVFTNQDVDSIDWPIERPHDEDDRCLEATQHWMDGHEARQTFEEAYRKYAEHTADRRHGCAT